jgi:ubiquinone/menaquinone biosynthesis C-methylase UbiE
MDYSADAVNIAHHYAESGNVIRGTATNFPFQNNVFDYVTILGFIECLDKEDIAKCLQESKRVLKQDGKIYLATPNAFGVIFFEFFATLHNLIVLRKNPKKNNWHHSRYVCSTFNYFSLRQLLKKNCLKPRIRFDSSTKGRLPSFVYKILFFTAPLHCIAEIEK